MIQIVFFSLILNQCSLGETEILINYSRVKLFVLKICNYNYFGKINCQMIKLKKFGELALY